MIKTIIKLLLITTMVFSLPVQADAEIAKAAVEKAIDAGFSELEKQIIEKYFGDKLKQKEEKETADKGKNKGKKKGLPPGLARIDKLPPGLQKQLERNGTLPPGLQKKALPDDLETRLPKEPAGFERTIVENAVVLVEKATGRIADIIKEVVVGD